MATVAQFQAALAAVDAETTRIAAKIDALIAELNADALDSAQEEAAFAGLQAAADRLRLVGVDVANPVPPVEEPPVEPSPEPPIV